MHSNLNLLQMRLYVAAVVVLVLGLGTALFIYSTAAKSAADSALVEEFQNSKVYRHELEAYGGKINVVASDLMQRFNGLWHGQSLAFTVAGIAVCLALALALVARHSESDQEEGDGRDGTPPPS